MSNFIIREPIWNGGKRCVGLDENRLPDSPYTTFEISYVDKQNKRIYPYPFVVRTSAVRACKRQWVGVWVRIVPLSLCEEQVPTNTATNRQGELI